MLGTAGDREDGLPWWGALLVTFIALLTMQVVWFIVSVLTGTTQDLAVTEAYDRAGRDVLNMALMQAVGMGLAVFAAVRWFHPESSLREALALHAPPVPVLALAILGGA